MATGFNAWEIIKIILLAALGYAVLFFFMWMFRTKTRDSKNKIKNN